MSLGKSRSESRLSAYAGPIQSMANVEELTEIVIAVHRNGLTQPIWVQPNSTILEMQPDGCVMDEEGPAAHAALMNYWIFHNDKKCSGM